ncbi:MAG: glutathione S-transferase family protein, partial [Nostocales cyanobacterium]
AKINTVLQFFEDKLDDRPYFGSDNLTLADIVAGSIVPWLPKTGVSLNEYPKVKAWCDRLVARPAWQQTETTPEMLADFKKLLMSRKS